MSAAIILGLVLGFVAQSIWLAGMDGAAEAMAQAYAGHVMMESIHPGHKADLPSGEAEL